MIGFIDKLLEKIIKRALHNKRQPIIDKSLDSFMKRHPDAATNELIAQIELETDRIIIIIDRSILRERIKRSKYIFWATAITSTIIIGALGAFTSGTAMPFAAPLLTALTVWIVSLATIPISYTQRVKGAVDSVVFAYEKALDAQPVRPEKENLKMISAPKKKHKKHEVEKIATKELKNTLFWHAPSRNIDRCENDSTREHSKRHSI